jgi:hypothetical protein
VHLAGVGDLVRRTLILYHNGVPSGTPISFLGLVQDRLNIIGLIIGSDSTSFFRGAIDDVRLWNVARTQAELVTHMNARLDGSESSLLGY